MRLALDRVPCALLLAVTGSLGATPQLPEDPPSRGLLLELTQSPRLAGTATSLHGVEVVARVLAEAGFDVEIDSRLVLLSLPRHLEMAVYGDSSGETPLRRRIDRFDPDAIPPGDIPLFNAWSGSGSARGEVVDAGWGLPEDFERLAQARIDVRGKIALCRYGRSYRGDKAAQAEAAGCAGLLLFTPASDDGSARGATWPAGPWKPPVEAQRGSVGPMTAGPGDPLTPLGPSPTVEGFSGKGAPPLDPAALARAEARLPHIPVLPIGERDAALILERLATRRIRDADGKVKSVRLGPGPVSVSLSIDAPRERRVIHNVIGRLVGERDEFVLAGNHRDSWVRGANDAGSGTVALLRAAQHLGRRRQEGWRPPYTIAIAFWDAEESGLIGSTEWAEAHAELLTEKCIAYLNGDTVVSGLELRVSGSPGLEGVLARALGQVALAPGRTLLEQWLATGREGLPRLALPGSGSDYTVFLHHLGIPVLDLGFAGNTGGQYHTAFDDFPIVERYLDPRFQGHELAGELFAALLAELATHGPESFDDAFAAAELERRVRGAAEWLGQERAEELAATLGGLSRSITLAWNRWAGEQGVSASGELGPFGTWPAFLDALEEPQQAEALAQLQGHRPPRFYVSLQRPEGLEGRPWFKNELWAPDPQNGYGTLFLPRLRAAADAGDEAALDAALGRLLARIRALREAWEGWR